MTETKTKAMRDMRSDLQDRADWIRHQIGAEQARFEIATTQLKREQTSCLKDLRWQLQAATRLLQLATWHHDVRLATAHALALAATAEIAMGQFSPAQDPAAIDRLSG